MNSKSINRNVWALTLSLCLGVIGYSTLSAQAADPLKAAAVAEACKGKKAGDEVTVDGKKMKCWAGKKIIKCSDAELKACASVKDEKACTKSAKSCCQWDPEHGKCVGGDTPQTGAKAVCIGGDCCNCHDGHCICDGDCKTNKYCKNL